jgi:hypothetical protein
MKFESALAELKKGRKVRRTGWHESFLAIRFFYSGTPSPIVSHTLSIPTKGDCNCIGMETDGQINPYWQPCQADMLGNDWMIVD